MKIGGNQAEAIPDLPIQPRNLDFDRKTEKIRKKTRKQLRTNSPNLPLKPFKTLFKAPLKALKRAGNSK